MNKAVEPAHTATRQRARGCAGRRWQVWTLMILALLVVGIYGALGLIFTRHPDVPLPTVQAATTDEATLTLQRAQQQALLEAGSWQPDAQLVGATTSWRLTAGDRLTLSRPAWSFSFYSPAASQVQIVTVTQEGAQAGRTTPVNVAPVPVEANWSLDSSDLLLTFMACGGEDFLKSHSHVNIHFQLKSEDAGQSIWYMTAIDPVAQQSLTVGMDALSRQVVVQG
jgi:hypothetical protein